MASSRRLADSSNESAASQLTNGPRADIDLTNRLSEALDNELNEEVKLSLNLDEAATPEQVLARGLSLRSDNISTASSFAAFHQQKRFEAAGFRKIGFGQCGLVFERPGRAFVIKVSRPHFEDALWADFLAHISVAQSFRQEKDLECRVPMVLSYVPKTGNEWWEHYGPLFPEDSSSAFPMPTMALVTERILPLPKILRTALVEKFCPQDLKPSVLSSPSNRDCLARIYLARKRGSNTSQPNFSLRNYNLCLDQMISLNLPVEKYATAIASALAVIHWSANVDGYDIEFVLGSEGHHNYTQDVTAILDMTPQQAAALPPHTNIDSLISANFHKRMTRIWVLDFNLCSRWEEKVGWEDPHSLVDQLVFSFFENDPYYPLPLMETDRERQLWEVFGQEYLRKSYEILDGGKDGRLRTLPTMFIDACIERERANLEKGLGHGHRDCKG